MTTGTTNSFARFARLAATAISLLIWLTGSSVARGDEAASDKPQVTATSVEDETWTGQEVRRGLLLALVASVLAGIWLARRGRFLRSRELPGLAAMDEAIARAAEMGRPTLFTVGGACNLRRVQLYAAMPLLRHAARVSAEKNNRLICPVCYAETLPVHVNAIREGRVDAGVSNTSAADDIRFFPGGQFLFAAAAMGWMLDEQPAACFYFGYWEADALLFAETGQTIQATQIAGTDTLQQVPFFVASCDHTLIGEEFWAASAKISGDPHLLGSLGAQDIFKLSVLAFIVAGCLACNWPRAAAFFDAAREILR